MEQVIHLLRQQAWKRAKGELSSMLASYNSYTIAGDAEKYIRFDKLLRNFVDTIEGAALHE